MEAWKSDRNRRCLEKQGSILIGGLSIGRSKEQFPARPFMLTQETFAKPLRKKEGCGAVFDFSLCERKWLMSGPRFIADGHCYFPLHVGRADCHHVLASVLCELVCRGVNNYAH